MVWIAPIIMALVLCQDMVTRDGELDLNFLYKGFQPRITVGAFEKVYTGKSRVLKVS